MKRVVILEAELREQPQFFPYARQAYEEALWTMITGDAMSSPPSPSELLQFAMQSGVKQQRLYAARTPDAPPTPQTVLNGIFRSRYR